MDFLGLGSKRNCEAQDFQQQNSMLSFQLTVIAMFVSVLNQEETAQAISTLNLFNSWL